MCSKKTREPFPRFLLPTGVCVALTGAGIIPAHATCSTAGLTVTCSGVANPLAPSYANSANNINATVNPGASVGVLLGVGGTAMSLTGNNVTLTNDGTIDPSALGAGLGVLSSGAVVGNASASLNTTVTNNGTMYGSTGVAISGVTGMALSVQNGTGGTSNIRNTGTIGSNPLVGATLSGADAPVVAAYGGGQVQMTNSGTINGRVSFGSNGTPGQGNMFTNSGTINGGVSMGANSNNTFTAVTGSSVNTAGGTGGAFNITVGPNTLNVAATGIVDGGAGGNNTLKLQQGTIANGTIAVNNYINFNHLNVQAGYWTINGASTAQDATLSGGVAIINDNASLGTGTITATGGALQAGTAGLDVSNNLALGAGGLTVQGATGVTLSGTVSGGGALTKNDGGTLTLSGANTYTGGTTINAGTLALGAGGSLASIGAVSLAGTGAAFDLSGASGAQTIGALSGVVGTNVNLGGNALTLAGSSNATYRGAIVGAGSLTLAGSGTQTLTGASTYAGGTTINAGTLSVSSDANLGAASGGLTFTGGVLATTGSFVSGRSVTLNGTGAFDVAAGDTLGLTGTLSGAGSFTKAGSGIFDYDGNGSGFTGMTEVAAGSLIVGSDASHTNAMLGGSVTANNGATLGGHGTVGSGSGSVITIGSGGTVAPGNSIGTLTVNGNYVQAAGSTYVAEIDPSGASDLIRVTGTATINGGTVSVLKAPGSYAPGTRYTLLTAAGGVTGTYGTLGQNMPFVDLALNYDVNDVFLDVARNNVAFPAMGITRNQKATAGALESLGSGSGLYTVIAGAPDAGTARADFDALSGEIHASARSALIDDSHFVRDAANNRIRSAFGDATGADMPLLGYGPDGVKPVTADSTGAVAWGQAFGTWGSYDGDGNAAGMDTSIGGFLAGLDGEVAENVRLGLLAGYSRTSFDVSDRASSGSSDNWHLGLYGGGKWNALRLSGGLAYTWHDIATSRSVAFPGVTDSLSSDYHAGTVQAFGEAGYRIDTAGGFAFEPFANLAYVSLHTNGFSEDGGNAALRGNGGTTDTTFTTLGLHLSSVFDLGGTKTNAHGTLGWRHAFGDTTPISRQAFAGSDTFTVAGVPIAQDAALIEAGLDVNLTKAATLGVAYQGQFGDGAMQNGFKADFSVKF
ncbi:autotransporter domain-containing protein [Rhizobium sp. BR 314]|uniref:autotransporter domain-containing protein n=1 Tax=Rhizobium sp. BR 314 TaxID=3040013 RepID=UPI0039BF8760